MNGPGSKFVLAFRLALVMALLSGAVGFAPAHPLDEPMPVGYFAGTRGEETVILRLSVGGRGLIGDWRQPGEEFPASLDGEFAAGYFRLEERSAAADVSGVWRGHVSRQGNVVEGRWLPPGAADETSPSAIPFRLERLATFTEIAANDAEEMRSTTTVPRFICTHLPGWDKLNRMLLAELPADQWDFLATQAVRPPSMGATIPILPECETWVQIADVSAKHVSLLVHSYRYDGGTRGTRRVKAMNLRLAGESWKPYSLREMLADRGSSWDEFQTLATEAMVLRHARLLTGEGKNAAVEEDLLEVACDRKGFTCYHTGLLHPQTGDPLAFRVTIPDPDPEPWPELPPEEPIAPEAGPSPEVSPEVSPDLVQPNRPSSASRPR